MALAGRVILYRNLGHGKFEDVTAKAGIVQLNRPNGLTFVDFDHDGDLDLFVTGSAVPGKGGPNVMWRNNGNSTFTEWTAQTGLAGQGSTTQAILSDINNDRAVDLVVTGDKGAPTVYLNQREGAFKSLLAVRRSPTCRRPAASLFSTSTKMVGWMSQSPTLVRLA